MAFQVSEELFQKIKGYLSRYEAAYGKKLSQREFVIRLIENALEESDEEFAALEAVREEEAADGGVCENGPPVSDGGTAAEEVPGGSEDAAVDAPAANVEGAEGPAEIAG